jgi:hypothetical protein
MSSTLRCGHIVPQSHDRDTLANLDHAATAPISVALLTFAWQMRQGAQRKPGFRAMAS